MEFIMYNLELWEPVIEQTIKVLVIPLIVYGGILLRAWIKTQVGKITSEQELDKLNEYIWLIEEMIHDAVVTVEKTFVKKLRKEGKWTQDSAIEAFHIVKMRVLEQITDDAKMVLAKAVNDYEEWITDKIESEVSRLEE